MSSEVDEFESGTGSPVSSGKNGESDGGVSANLRTSFRYGCLEMIRVSEDKRSTKKTNFTIDYILGSDLKRRRESTADQHYDWLNYTRYKPPKLQS